VIPAHRSSARAGLRQATEIIGYDQSEQLDVEPAKYFVLVTKREKRACKCARKAAWLRRRRRRGYREESGERPGGDRHGGGQV